VTAVGDGGDWSAAPCMDLKNCHLSACTKIDTLCIQCPCSLPLHSSRMPLAGKEGTTVCGMWSRHLSLKGGCSAAWWQGWLVPLPPTCAEQRASSSPLRLCLKISLIPNTQQKGGQKTLESGTQFRLEGTVGMGPQLSRLSRRRDRPEKPLHRPPDLYSTSIVLLRLIHKSKVT